MYNLLKPDAATRNRTQYLQLQHHWLSKHQSDTCTLQHLYLFINTCSETQVYNLLKPDATTQNRTQYLQLNKHHWKPDAATRKRTQYLQLNKHQSDTCSEPQVYNLLKPDAATGNRTQYLQLNKHHSDTCTLQHLYPFINTCSETQVYNLLTLKRSSGSLRVQSKRHDSLMAETTCNGRNDT